ncbi:hypothetical protein RhiirA5_494960 [Rhizophagus irregularis]|uniref:t-SNARE coiled-coil homology domain-containing protein n=2 Tax=Rhizophagus irregularis TaxID=588596 RepID=A0A2I1FBD4_9GLOM|nr:hypothetical protein RhiirA5_494960 [Rhizophagus irregularis]PKC75546.1 hypothetical protein RhiirA1_528751 [Rhizophagus irregularis]PKY31647.1 hypothetical protein RhiirB3_531691 [Rhizophagus irregularis]CAG8463562.1 23261_t:CDS:2 [Rhizophagus irregularis]
MSLVRLTNFVAREVTELREILITIKEKILTAKSNLQPIQETIHNISFNPNIQVDYHAIQNDIQDGIQSIQNDIRTIQQNIQQTIQRIDQVFNPQHNDFFQDIQTEIQDIQLGLQEIYNGLENFHNELSELNQNFTLIVDAILLAQLKM